MENMNNLSFHEACSLRGGAAPLLTTVVAIGAISILLVTAFKLYKSSQGEASLGPGIRFKWFIK